MINIISEVNRYLLTVITLYSDIKQNSFIENVSDEIMVRQEPSTAVENRYLTGSRVGGFNFAYFTKSKDQKKARDQLDLIVQTLDLKKINLTDTDSIKIEVVTSTNYVTKLESGEHIFTASFKLEYIMR